ELKSEEALYLQPGRLQTAPPRPEQLTRDLRALLAAAALASSVSSTQELAEKLIDLLLEVLPAERGAMLLSDADPETSSEIFTRPQGSGQAPPVSRTIFTRVLRAQQALVANEILGLESLREAKSLIESRIHAVMAVPMLALNKVQGV